jgi:predicted phage terminase large subunit-like protein
MVKAMVQQTPSHRALAIELMRSLARQHFSEFVPFMQPDYYMGWFHLRLAKAIDRFVEDVLARRSPRLIIEAPPRHGKSTQASRLLPAYLLGRNPDLEVLGTSYGDALAYEFCADVQKIIDNEKYHVLFPDTRIPGQFGKRNAAKRSADHFEIIRHKGHYRAAGLYSALTGRGADVLIIDDPVKGLEDSLSAAQRSKAYQTFASVAMTRVHRGGGIVIIGSRWNEDDIVGRILADETWGSNWQHLSFPAIAEEDEHDEDGQLLRQRGAPLCPELKSLAELHELKARLSVSMWSAIYQQKPAPETGSLLKRFNWRYWQPVGANLPPVVVTDDEGNVREIYAETLPLKFDRGCMSWDLNFGDARTQDPDYVVGLVVRTRGAKRFVIDRYKKQADFTETVQAMRDMISRYPDCSARYVEKAANGAASMNLLETTYGITGLIPVVKDKNKILYADAANDQLRAGNWYLPHPQLARWVDDFLHTLTMFPNGKYDDDVDAWSQAAMKLQSSSRLDVFLEEVEVFPHGFSDDRYESLLTPGRWRLN